MRWGKPRVRHAIARGYLPAAALLASTGAAGLSTYALADVFRLRPFVIAEQLFTDNVASSSDDRDAEGVTSLAGRAEIEWQTSRINALADVELRGEKFWSTDDLDNINASGFAGGRFKVVRNFFYVDALVERQEDYLTPTGEGAADLPTTDDRNQRTNYDISPAIEADIFGLADLVLRARYAQIFFSDPIVGPDPAVLLDDATIKQVAGSITTGERSSLYEALGSAEYLETDTGFESRTIVGSLFLHLTQSFSAIGRIGYEKIFDPLFPEIRGTIWAAGFRYRLGEASNIHIEYGKRYGDVSWAGDFNLLLTPYFSVSGEYRDVLLPSQLTLVRQLTDLLEPDGTFEVGAPQGPNIPDPAITQQIVRDKELVVAAAYTQRQQTVTLTGSHTERQDPVTAELDKLMFVNLALTERLSRRLTYNAQIEYQDNYDVPTGQTVSKTYFTELSVSYDFNEKTSVEGRYSYRLLTEPGDIDTYENVLVFTLSREL